jgi:hypothetical protein
VSSFALDAVILHFAFGFGAIHLLAVWALWTIWAGVQDARRAGSRRIAVGWRASTGRSDGRGSSDAFARAGAERLSLRCTARDRPLGHPGFGAGLLWINLRGGLTAPSVPERHRREVR